MWAASVTQTRAAAAIGVSQSQMSKRVRGLIEFRADELTIIAGLCGVSVASLISEPAGAVA